MLDAGPIIAVYAIALTRRTSNAHEMYPLIRSQLEGLLEVVPPSSWVRPKPGTGARDVRGPSEARGGTQSADFPGGTTKETPDGGGSFAISTSTPPLERRVESQDSGDLENRDVKNDKRMHAVSGIGCGDGGHGGDETEGGTLDELKRRCSLLEIALKASRREASEARRARDVAELTVSKQRAALVTLRTRVSDLEASFAKEQGSGKVRTVWHKAGCGRIGGTLTNCCISRDWVSADRARNLPRFQTS